MSKKPDLAVFVILLATFVIWSNSFIAVGLLRQKLSVWELVSIRFIPVGFISSVLVGLFYRLEFYDLIKRHFCRLAVMSLLCVTSYNFFLFWGQAYISPNAASLIITLNPLFTLFLAVRFLGEPLTIRRLGGTIIAFLGLGLVVVWGQVGLSESLVIPLAKLPFAGAVMLAPLSWAGYTVLAKPISTECSPAGLNFSVLTVGCLPFYFTLRPSLIKKALSLTPVETSAWLFLSLLCTIVAFYLWLLGVKQWRASNVSLFVFLNPPLTAAFSYLYFGQKISTLFFLGGAVMLLGIALAVTDQIKSPVRLFNGPRS